MNRSALLPLAVLIGLMALAPTLSPALPEAPMARAAANPGSLTLALDDPLIVKANWESALLRTGDLNGDGRMDFATVNNPKGSLEVFLQEPGQPLRFSRKDLALDQPLSSMALGDINGDGRPDLILAPQQKNLQIRFQQDQGVFGLPVAVEAQAAALQAQDIDGDGHDDVVGLSKEKTVILNGIGEAKAAVGEPVVFLNGAAPATYPLLGDLDGNGLDDIAYVDAARRSRLLVRFQSAPRAWDLEAAFDIGEAGDAVFVRGQGPRAQALLALLHPPTREVRLYRFERPAGTPEKLPLQAPRYLALGASPQPGRLSVASADIDGNGSLDLALASPDAAEVMLYLQAGGGRFRPVAAPSLSGITALAATPRPQGALLFALSAEREEAMGAAAWDRARGLSAPAFLPTPQKPFAMAAGDLNASGIPDFAYIYRDSAKGYRLAVYPDPQGAELLRQAPATRTLPLNAETEVDALAIADLNGDSRGDLLVFGKYAPLQILLQRGGGTFAPIDQQQAAIRGILNAITPEQLALAELDGKPGMEILIARENFARAYAMSADGSLAVSSQFNGRNASARIEAACAADLDGDGRKEVVLLDSANKCLSLFARTASGVFALARNQEFSGNMAQLRPLDANGDRRDDLLLAGEGVQLLLAGPAEGSLKMIWKKEPTDPDGRYVRVAARPVLGRGAAGPDQLIILEDKEHMLEFIRPAAAEEGEPEALFRFKMFDDESSMGRGPALSASPEPRSMLAADMNDDGMNDLLALVHDNVLIYLRK